MPAAIVTASDSGIGRASGVALAEAGFDVGVTWHTDEEGARGTASEVEGHGRRAEVRQLDLNHLPEAGDVIDDLADALGGIDVLVNNAGRGSSTPMVEMGFDEWRDVLAVNLDGAFVCAQRAARRMSDQGRGGRIVNITSVHEFIPLPGGANYCASKGGLGMLTKVMALELAEHGIRVNAVAPGEIATPMTGQHDVDPTQGRDKPYVPLERAGEAREIASLVVWLASPGASYANGSSFVVDGGLMLKAAAQSS
ncbi:MAG TPA: SDR family oxidoreductase [Thermoleophilaceae bacterium]|nr:SDR family oxidoreductase [Thermoleophilaceae bacterium]